MNKLLILLAVFFFSCNSGEEVNPNEDFIEANRLLGTWEVESMYNGDTEETRDWYMVYSNLDFLAFRFSKVEASEIVDPKFMYKYEGVVVYNTPEVDTVTSSAYIKIQNNQIQYYNSMGKKSPTLPSEDIHSLTGNILKFHWHNVGGYTQLKTIADERFDNYWPD